MIQSMQLPVWPAIGITEQSDLENNRQGRKVRGRIQPANEKQEPAAKGVQSSMKKNLRGGRPVKEETEKEGSPATGPWGRGKENVDRLQSQREQMRGGNPQKYKTKGKRPGRNREGDGGEVALGKKETDYHKKTLQ